MASEEAVRVPTSHEETRLFGACELAPKPTAREVLFKVKDALDEKGYRAVDQIVGYLVSGDPAYITSHKDARLWIRRIEKDELLEEIVRHYLERA